MISSEPDGPFSISSVSDDGMFTAEISGLDRKKDFNDVLRKMKDGLGQLVQYISFVRVARVAEAACAQAFLVRGLELIECRSRK